MTTFSTNSLFGKYRILRLLGQGGMADVYEAEDTTIGRKVALKILPLAFARDEERAKRFAKEIQACAQLDHPNIVSVLDVGQVDNFHYYSMSILPGGDLKDCLKQGAMQPKMALRITREIAGALHYAHKKGFVHRDVKPENILFGEDGRAILTDFGIARATTGGTRMTATGLSIGTPHYMSPEQARGKDVDGRSDLYALGILLYEMMTGNVPFDATDSMAIGIMHLQEPVPLLPTQVSKYQPVLEKLLAKNRLDRYQSAQLLTDDLDRIENGLNVKIIPGGTRLTKRLTSSHIGDEQLPNNKIQWLTLRAKRSPKVFAFGGIALGLAVYGLLYFWLGEDEQLPERGSAESAETDDGEASIAAIDPLDPPSADEVTTPLKLEPADEQEATNVWNVGDLVPRRSLSSPAQIPGLPESSSFHDVMSMEQRQVVLRTTDGRRDAELILVVHGARSKHLDDVVDPARVTIGLQEGQEYRIIYSRRFAYIDGSARLDYHYFDNVQLDDRYVVLRYRDAQGSRPFSHTDFLWVSEKGELLHLEIERIDQEMVARAASSVETFSGITIPFTYLEDGNIFRTYEIALEGDAGCCPSGGRLRVDYELQVDTEGARLVPVRYGVIDDLGEFVDTPLEVRHGSARAETGHEQSQDITV